MGIININIKNINPFKKGNVVSSKEPHILVPTDDELTKAEAYYKEQEEELSKKVIANQEVIDKFDEIFRNKNTDDFAEFDSLVDAEREKNSGKVL